MYDYVETTPVKKSVETPLPRTGNFTLNVWSQTVEVNRRNPKLRVVFVIVPEDPVRITFATSV